VPELRNEKPSEEEEEVSFPDNPKRPLRRIITESMFDFGFCDFCGSSLKSRFIFFGSRGCVQPLCENYYRRDRQATVRCPWCGDDTVVEKGKDGRCTWCGNYHRWEGDRLMWNQVKG